MKYPLCFKNKKVVMEDEKGGEILLLDLSDVYKNMSGIPLRSLEKDENGHVTVREIVWEELSGRRKRYPEIFGSDTSADIMFVMDCLLAGKLMSSQKPMLTAIIDAADPEVNAISNSTGWYNAENAALGIRSEGRYDIFREHGFDIVVIFGDDSRAEAQLKAAGYLMKDDALLLMVDRDTRYFKYAADLFISDFSEIRIDEENSVLKAEGRKAFRSSMEKRDLEREYLDIRKKIREFLAENETQPEIREKNIREISGKINSLIKESAGRSDLEKKQDLLDLKESFQMYIMNRDNAYSGDYREGLEKLI